MPNRYVNQDRNDYRSFPKFEKIKDFQNPSTHQTLSNYLRSTTATDKGVNVDAAAASSSTATMGENWELIKETSPGGSFVIYLPQDEAVAAGLGPDEGGLDPVESQCVVDLLNRELSRLLKLSPKDFWTEVSIDESLYTFLESFLRFRNRWYDFPYHGPRGIVAGVMVGELELCGRVFMFLYRLSSNRDPGAKAADTLSPKDHAVLLQNKKLLDLPKLLDICAIYGRENEDLTRTLVMNAMKAQPHILDDFSVLMSHFLCITQTMHQRCYSTLEVLLNSSSCGEQDRLCFDYLEVMDFINDAVVSMDSFITSYKHAAIFFSSPIEMSDGNEELLTTLAKLHDSLLPCLQRGFYTISATVDDRDQEISGNVLSNALVSLKMLSMRIAEFGWKLLYFCYLSYEAFESSYSPPVFTKMFPASVEDPVVRADILMQTLKDLSGNYTHAAEGSSGTFIQNIEKNHQIMSRIELLQKSGWISMDDEQFQFLAGIMKHSKEIYKGVKNSTSFPVPVNRILTDENAAIVESKIIQIKEIFPDCGRGFLVACLEAYNQDAEEVIQRILEGTLHEELQSLDISLERIPPSKSASSGSVHKGKEKLVDTMSPSGAVVSTVVKNEAGVSSSSSSTSVGRFIRKNADELSNFETLDARKDKELVKTAALISQLEYEDEYDDSFDDLGFSVCDSVLEESETLGDRLSTPRGGSTEADGGSSTSNTENSKWNSSKKPLFYVKDGKNYSYKVAGSIAVANYGEAKLVNLAQKELVHGLGRGGNIPLGNIKRLMELNEQQEDRPHTHEVGGRGNQRNARDLGKRSFPLGVVKKPPESNEEQNDGQDTNGTGGRGGRGNSRGGGRRSRGRNHHRQDRSMNKHFSGMPGHFA